MASSRSDLVKRFENLVKLHNEYTYHLLKMKVPYPALGEIIKDKLDSVDRTIEALKLRNLATSDEEEIKEIYKIISEAKKLMVESQFMLSKGIWKISENDVDENPPIEESSEIRNDNNVFEPDPEEKNDSEKLQELLALQKRILNIFNPDQKKKKILLDIIENFIQDLRKDASQPNPLPAFIKTLTEKVKNLEEAGEYLESMDAMQNKNNNNNNTTLNNPNTLFESRNNKDTEPTAKVKRNQILPEPTNPKSPNK